jgi:hypothetical protein
MEQHDGDGWHNGDGRCNGQWQWTAGRTVMECLRTAQRRRDGNGATWQQLKVMDIATATAMNDMLATLQRWTGNGDECHDGDSDGNGWLIGNVTAMNGLLASRW